MTGVADRQDFRCVYVNSDVSLLEWQNKTKFQQKSTLPDQRIKVLVLK